MKTSIQKTKNIIINHRGQTSGYAKCQDCDFLRISDKISINCSKEANRHVKETGHTVDVNRVMSYEVKSIVE